MSLEDEKRRLISEVYQVVLQSERYDVFIDVWEDYFMKVLSSQENIDLPAELASDVEVGKLGTLEVEDSEITSHFERAFGLLEKMGRTIGRPLTAQEIVDRKQQPAVMISKNAKIEALNEAAQQLFGAPVTIDDLSPIFYEDTIDNVRQFLKSFGRDRGQNYTFFLDTNLSEGQKNKQAEDYLFIARPISLVTDDTPRLLVFALQMNWNRTVEEFLEDLYGLTSKELWIVREVCSGKTLKELADLSGRSILTLRNQMKSIQSKTDVNSQIDLVQKILTLANIMEKHSLQTVTRTCLELPSRRDIPVAGKRLMPVYFIGPEKGRPVLFIHGMLDGVAVNKKVLDALQEFDIRLVAPVRPYFDDSPPAYTAKTAPEEFAQDLKYIIEALELGPLPVMGHMAGSVYAFAAAAYLPKKICGIFNVSGGIPIITHNQFYGMASRQRVFALTALFSPKIFSTIIRFGVSEIDNGNECSVMKALYGKTRLDRQIVEGDNTISSVVFEGYRFTVTQGHKAFETDSYHVTRDWSAYVELARQPTILVHGRHDPVVTIGTVQDFEKRCPDTRLFEIEDSGQLIFYHRPRQVLSQLEGLFVNP